MNFMQHTERPLNLKIAFYSTHQTVGVIGILSNERKRSCAVITNGIDGSFVLCPLPDLSDP